MITPVQAEEDNTRYEMLLEDVIYTFFYPLEKKATNEYFGEFKQSMFCKFVDVKRKPNMGYAYEITYQFKTFEGAHNPPFYLFTMTVENEELTNWVIKEVQVKKLNGEKVECRKPIQIQ
ncbi:DUF3888 domain-containing protein [Halalkalibacter alkalisediminis]|uniref:DUF3888 domain-containing protein n=2 Tax=Halalkalibacter alkalisediminis TaxID=935616 RepID=A0ABV6NL16_9BACI